MILIPFIAHALIKGDFAGAVQALSRVALMARNIAALAGGGAGAAAGAAHFAKDMGAGGSGGPTGGGTGGAGGGSTGAGSVAPPPNTPAGTSTGFVFMPVQVAEGAAHSMAVRCLVEK